ncbi:MAG TPA: methyltransferase domain-containing protein [Longimicrobiaceae bacterium]|jgi:SAM-dependent methyltransferase
MKRCLRCSTRFGGAEWDCPACGWTADTLDGVPAFAPELSRDGYEAAFFAPLAEAEPGHFWFEARNRLIAGALRRHFPAAERFLEVGCGTGFVLAGVGRAFPGWSLTGSDLFPEGLAFARRRVPRAALFQMDARRIPFEAEFDVAGAFDVLEHVEEDEAVLAELRRSVRPGGGILLTVPQHPRLWGPMDDLARHRRRYTRAELVKKVERAGFRVERVTSFVSLLLPLMAGSRLLRPRRRVEADPMAELRVHPAANRVLGLVLDAERRLIERGFSLPAGGSLLLAARRPPAAA